MIGPARLTRRQDAPAAAASGWRALAVEALIAAAATAAAAAARIAIEQVVGGVAPFILTFPAVMIATLAGGGRAGAIAAVGLQLLTIRYVFPDWVSPHGGVTTDLANVLLSTMALAGTVWATASYRNAAALLRAQCEHRADTLSLLIAEMDHRTKNNFQIAAGLLAHQAVSSLDGVLARELDRAASRLESIASVYQDLALTETSHERIDLADHLGRIVAMLRTGAAPAEVFLGFRAEPAVVPVNTAIIVGLIVNEWVTNALKHAFDGKPGRVDVDVARRGGATEIVVRDDGGVARTDIGSGRGGDLVRSLAEVIGAEVAIDYRRGTRCILSLPS